MRGRLVSRLLAALIFSTPRLGAGERGSAASSRLEDGGSIDRDGLQALLAQGNGDLDRFRVFTNNKRMTLSDEDPAVILSVYFKFETALEVMSMKLPPGYEMVEDKNLGCGVYALGSGPSADVHENAESKAFAQVQNAAHLIKHIEKCQVFSEEREHHGEKLTAVEVRMKMKPDVEGLSKDPEKPDEGLPEKWWCFAMHVKNPKVNPAEKDNWFHIRHWVRDDQKERGSWETGSWEGEVRFHGWPILGDWPCKYSEWQGWGQCSARCGLGSMRLTRSIILAPPGHSKGYGSSAKCDAPLERVVSCNMHQCKFPCELVDVPPPGICSSECGGGVKATRPRWRGAPGKTCPGETEKDAVQLQQCNMEPCKVRCKLADTWTVVTPCSEMCGPGTYRMMRQVLQKDKNDPACQPEWREVPCVRQWCTQLSIIRPDRNVLPYPNDKYYVGIAFKLTVNTNQITLSAPAGYSFGTPGSDCWLHDHDLVPYYQACKVGVQKIEDEDGSSWSEENSITIILAGVLPRNGAGRYHFMILVKNPSCPHNQFEEVLRIGDSDEPQPKEICKISPEFNQWTMKFRKEIVEKSHLPTLMIMAKGYDLHNPKGRSSRHSTAGPKDEFALAPNSDDFISMEDTSWRASRPIFCSPRLEPCPGDVPCPDNGVCPAYDDEQDVREQIFSRSGKWELDEDDSPQYEDTESAKW